MFFYHVFVVGPSEELIKFLAFAFLATKLRSIKELKDGILQACSVALGFAAAENFKYGWYYGLDVFSIVGINEWVKGYRIEKFRRDRYINRS